MNCEHCGAPLDQYNGPVKFSLGQEVEITNHPLEFLNGKRVRVKRIDRANYPDIYLCEDPGDNDKYFREDVLTNVSIL